MSQPTISDWERNDESLPAARRWRAVARAYGIPVSAFLPPEDKRLDKRRAVRR